MFFETQCISASLNNNSVGCTYGYPACIDVVRSWLSAVRQQFDTTRVIRFDVDVAVLLAVCLVVLRVIGCRRRLIFPDRPQLLQYMRVSK